MKIKEIEKRRKAIVALSLLLTILLILVFLFAEILLGLAYWWAMILVFMLFVACLYGLSKWIIMPLYDTLVVNIFSKVLSDRFPKASVRKGKKIAPDFYYLFNKEEITLSNHFLIDFKNFTVDIFDFAEKSGKKRTKDIKTSYGRMILFHGPFKSNLPSVYILENKKETERFKTYYATSYPSCNDSLTYGKKYRRYCCFYQRQFAMDALSILGESNDFHALKIDEKSMQLLMINKNDGFCFRLQDHLKEDIFVYCKQKYADFFRMAEAVDEKIKEQGGENDVR